MSSLRITPQERALVSHAQSNSERRGELLKRFWYNRVLKQDPVARIGFSLWCMDTDKLKRVVASGDKTYWNNKGYRYWWSMGFSTFINVAAGLEQAGFKGDSQEVMRKIEEIGAKIALRHIEAVQADYRNKTGKIPGLLSLQQMASYHHRVFEIEGIPKHYYGGTRIELIPNDWEFELYGELYCHDCDPRP